jgi:hypothetical protein
MQRATPTTACIAWAVRSQSRTGSNTTLLLRSLHLVTQIGIVTLEPLVAIGARVGTFGNAAKSVEVELPLEGC